MYERVRQLLQNETENTYEKFITKCYRSLLQRASGITKCNRLLSQTVSYYKVVCNSLNACLI